VPLAILAFFALFRSLSALVGDLLVATGNPSKFRAITGLQLALAAGGLYFGATLGGMVGVALVMTTAQGISLVVGWIFAARVVGARAGEFAQAVRGPVAASVVASAASVLALRVLPHEGNLPALLAAVGGVVVLFFAVWAVLDAKLRSDFAKALRRGEAT
jgi:O-antigen/teichoic acid export membrane protein